MRYAIAALVATLAAPASSLEAATIRLAFSGEFDFVRGRDALGLDGASFEYTVDFTDGATWVEATVLFDRVNATSHSIFVSGASVPTSNGRFSGTFAPNLSQIRGSRAGTLFGQLLLFGELPFLPGMAFFNQAPVIPRAGDRLLSSHIGELSSWSESIIFRADPDFALYGQRNVDFSVSTIPSPSTLGLVSFGTFVLALRRRRAGIAPLRR